MSQCCSTNCKYLCDYEFDTLALYLNFKDKSLWDVRYAIEKWCTMTKVDLSKIKLCYNHIDYVTAQKYGLHYEIEEIQFLNTLGNDYLNFFRRLDTTVDDNIRLFNYVSSHRSLCIFYGERSDLNKTEFFQYTKCSEIPVITITPLEFCKVFWVGIPDKDYELLYGDDSYRRY